MRVKVWGARGSLPTPGPSTARYGGNTACVEVRAPSGAVLILDAGTGIRALGQELEQEAGRIDLLLTHLHMDHILGLGFFAPLFQAGRSVHIWGPAGVTLPLSARLNRYLSPPLFPVHLRDLPCDLQLHEAPFGEAIIGGLIVSAALVCHPNPTVGYRISGEGATLTYLPDHEPALGLRGPYQAGGWTSGYSLAAGADLLIHDAQYTPAEYAECVGWGHSTLAHAVGFADLASVRRLLLFHHHPAHTDEDIDRLTAGVVADLRPPFAVSAAVEGATFELGR